MPIETVRAPQEKSRKLLDFYAHPIKKGDDGKEYSATKTSLHLDEALTLQNLVLESKACRTLEIGLALGGSAVAIAEAQAVMGLTATHVALDPFQTEYGNAALRELARLELQDRVEFRPEYSEDYLSTGARNGAKFDLIFNDGDHSIGGKVTTTFFADKCLTDGGIMAFHDALRFSTAACVRYLVLEQSYEVLALPPDSSLRRLLRVAKYSLVHGPWYGTRIVPRTHRGVVALRKPLRP